MKSMKKSRGIITLILVLGILAGLCYYSATIISSTGVGEDRSINLGLDLAGGVSITYQVVGDKPTDEQLDDTVYKLQKRVEGYSTEAQVYKVGDDRISVEIPGVSDANKILEELGKPGTLEFQTEDGKTFMDGSAVAQAKAATITNDTGNKENIVELTLTDEGAKTFAEVTSANVGKALPIVYDDEVISYPTVQQAITGGTAQISGMANYEEAESLASQIRIGSLLPKVRGDAFRGSRCTAWRGSDFKQFESSSDRSCDRYDLYDHAVLSTWCGSRIRTCNLYDISDRDLISV